MAHDDDEDSGGTERIPEGGGGPPRGPLSGVVLLFNHHDAATSATLLPGRPLVVGRAPRAGLSIPDRTLSREHARFTLSDGQVIVEDLGTTNGTSIGGKRIERATHLPVGGEAMLGTVLVHVFGVGAGAPRSLESDTGFRAMLGNEITRCRAFHRTFALVAVRSSEGVGQPGGVWAARLHEHLRTVDHVQVYTWETANILLAEASLEQATAVAHRITSSGPGRLVGIAMFPEAATTVDALIASAHDALGRARPGQAVIRGGSSRADVDDDSPIRGESLRGVYDEAARAARFSIPILLAGETGTGKEVLARFIHANSPRHKQKDGFIAVNCGAIPPSLLEATLFGHEKGAFTGADKEHQGCFEKAHQGTLFLDEIGELPKAAQVALLRVLESGSIKRVGGNEELKVDVRVIAATHRDLRAMIEEGEFREDLYYRLNSFEVTLPPLRERTDEIERLCDRFRRRAVEKDGLHVRGISPEALDILLVYPWPGNVRELRNAVERAVVVADGEEIQPEDLPSRLLQAPGERMPTLRRRPKGKPKHGALRADLDALEAKKIEDALRATRTLAAAAERLGITVAMLQRRKKALGISSPRPKPRKR